MSQDIRNATMRRCIEEQEAHRTAHEDAVRYRRLGLFGRAAQEQRESRYHYDQMWIRLERILGLA
jgi:hypothetical protein